MKRYKQKFDEGSKLRVVDKLERMYKKVKKDVELWKDEGFDNDDIKVMLNDNYLHFEAYDIANYFTEDLWDKLGL